MSNEPYLNDNQYPFLCNLHEHPHGLPLEEWPRTSTLRRWIKRPRFRRAIRSLKKTFHSQADLMLAGSTARAATLIQVILSGEGCSGAGATSREILQHQLQL